VAAVTHLFSSQLTTNLSSYTTASFSPTATGDLLVVFVGVTASASATPTLTESAGGGTYALVTPNALKAASADLLYVFIRNTLTENTTARTLTWTSSPTDAATTFGLLVARVTGMSRAGATAIRQKAVANNQALGTTPATTFALAALTTNPCIGCVFNGSNPATVTPPASFVERLDTGIGTPNAGMEYASRDSGHTSATITWASTSATAFGVQSLELDVSAVAVGSPPRPQIAQQAVARAASW
jgi:hypothetical protein